jgi:GxxExxY protein
MSEAMRNSVVDPRLELVSHLLIGAAIEVHRVIGPGASEGVCEDALVCELGLRRVPVQRQVEIPVIYKGHRLRDQRIDLLVAGSLIVEIKSVTAILDIHRAQLLTYLRLANLPLGLLINFNVPRLYTGLARILNERALTRVLDIRIDPSWPSAPLRDLRVDTE